MTTAGVPDPLVGQVVDGKYRIEARLGVGGMGTAYRAVHVALGTPRAVKVMRRELARDPVFVERFQNEARLAEELRHPHLVSLYDFGQLPDGAWFIVSELVEGETVAELLRRGACFASAEVAELLGQVADGLSVAHGRGIVHRDISPDNIMITRAGELRIGKLLDFGIAKDVLRGSSFKTEANLMLGKVGYASPELLGLLAPDEWIDGRSDVFSLTAVACEMLTGALPWSKESLQSYVHDVLVRPEEQTAARLRALAPDAWQRALAQGLARQREARTPTMRALRADFERAARRAEREARASMREEKPTLAVTLRTAPPAPRRRLRAVAIGGSLVGAGWVALWVLALSPPGPTPEAARPVPSASAPPPTSLPVPASPRPADGAALATAAPEPTPTARAPVRRPSPPPSLPTAAARPPVAEPTPPPSTVPPRFGSLSVTSDVWYEVAVDDGPTQQTPFHVDRLSVGAHTLRVSRPGYRLRRIDVEVREGDTARVNVVLEREP